MSNKLGEFFDLAGNENNAVMIAHSAVAPPPLLQANCHQQFQVLLVVEISLFLSPFKMARLILQVALFPEAPSTTAVLILM